MKPPKEVQRTFKNMINFTETEKYQYPWVEFKPVKDVLDNPDKLAST